MYPTVEEMNTPKTNGIVDRGRLLLFIRIENDALNALRDAFRIRFHTMCDEVTYSDDKSHRNMAKKANSLSVVSNMYDRINIRTEKAIKSNSDSASIVLSFNNSGRETITTEINRIQHAIKINTSEDILLPDAVTDTETESEEPVKEIATNLLRTAYIAKEGTIPESIATS